MAEPIIYLRETPRDPVVRNLLPDYPHADLRDVECYLLLLRVVHEMVGRVERQLAARGISRGRLAVLMILRLRAAGLNAAALAQHCGVTRATMTGLLSGLGKAGLVSFAAHSTDGRMRRVGITGKGRKVLAGILPDYYALLWSFTRRVQRKELAQLNGSLARLLHELTRTQRDNAVTGPASRSAAAGIPAAKRRGKLSSRPPAYGRRSESRGLRS